MAFRYCHRLRLCVCPCVCVCVCVCINHLLVHTITHQLFKLASPNLGQRCKTLWSICLLFLGVIDFYLPGQILLESRILPQFELVRMITFHAFKLESPNLDQKCILVRLRCLLCWGLIEMHLNTVKIPIDFGRDRPSASIYFLNVKAIFLLICAVFVSHLVRPGRKSQWDNCWLPIESVSSLDHVDWSCSIILP